MEIKKGKVIPIGKMVTVNNHKMHIYINGGWSKYAYIYVWQRYHRHIF